MRRYLLQVAGAYPRGRGGTMEKGPASPAPQGLSPRARGNRRPTEPRECGGGPIPAGAGEPSPRAGQLFPCMAYPRGRGGTSVSPLRPVKM